LEKLCNVKAQASLDQITIQDLPWRRFHTFKVVSRENCYYLAQTDDTAPTDFAVLDLVTTAYLHSLRQFTGLFYTAVVSSSWLGSIPRKSTRKKTIIDLTVNVMGPENLADDVGEAVAVASGYLQHPFFLEAGIPYINPHYFYPGNQKSDLRHLIGPAKTDSRAMRVYNGIETVLESLDNLPSLSASVEEKDFSFVVNQRLVDTQLKRFNPHNLLYISSQATSLLTRACPVPVTK
jgi:hypothetical protein